MNTMKALFLFFSLFLFAPMVRAEYVLPYPSFMPGSKMYTVSRIVDQVKEYWYFGNLAKAKYHMILADKYLVEAKTLFEYKQYLLATRALSRSTDQFGNIGVYLKRAKGDGKDVDLWSKTLVEQASSHIQVLAQLRLVVPSEFIWKPENAKETNLSLINSIDQAIIARKQAL